MFNLNVFPNKAKNIEPFLDWNNEEFVEISIYLKWHCVYRWSNWRLNVEGTLPKAMENRGVIFAYSSSWETLTHPE